MLLAGLSTGHKVGLGLVALVFIAFALISSFVAPRGRPEFPGRSGLRVYVIACFVLFAAMIAAVEVFGGESEPAKAQESAPAKGGAPGTTIKVQEKEFKIVMPPAKTEPPGRYTFVSTNVGKIPHDLAIQGPGVTGVSKTPLISPGKSAKLTVSLTTGQYTLSCTVPGHKQLGMVAKLVVG